MKLLCAVLCCVAAVVFLSCDSRTSLGNQAPSPERSFIDVDVVQVQQYAKWEKPYFGNRAFTGDTISISMRASEPGIVTFFESTVNADPISPSDTATVTFQMEGSILRQIGGNRSRLLGFVANHDGILHLTDIDSNQIVVNLDTSLFMIRQQTGKSRFVGHSDRVQLFCDNYDNVNVYYDQTPTYYDGFGHLAIHSRQEGLVATVYFGGFSNLEQYGYQLIRR